MTFVPRQCKGCKFFTPGQQMPDAIFGGFRVLGDCRLRKGLYDQEHGCNEWFPGAVVGETALPVVTRGPWGGAYTADELETVRAVARSGGSMKNAAARTGRTESSIANIATRHKIKFNGRGKAARLPHSHGLSNRSTVPAI